MPDAAQPAAQGLQVGYVRLDGRRAKLERGPKEPLGAVTINGTPLGVFQTTALACQFSTYVGTDAALRGLVGVLDTAKEEASAEEMAAWQQRFDAALALARQAIAQADAMMQRCKDISDKRLITLAAQ